MSVAPDSGAHDAAEPGSSGVSPTGSVDGAPVGYSERLTVPWWAWPAGLGLAALMAAEVYLGASALAWLPYAILLPATAAGLVALGRIRVRVAGGELFVDDARIPVNFITEVNPLDAETKRVVLGPLAVPDVFAVGRPWIPGAVRIVIDDPADPTPYWVISTRRPVELAEALVRARDASARDPR